VVQDYTAMWRVRAAHVLVRCCEPGELSYEYTAYQFFVQEQIKVLLTLLWYNSV
jgi:hypothetical protein